MSFQIIAIRKPEQSNHQHAITAVKLADNTILSIQDVVSLIPKFQFFVRDAHGDIASVRVENFVNKWITTRADLTKDDNLLSLPRF